VLSLRDTFVVEPILADDDVGDHVDVRPPVYPPLDRRDEAIRLSKVLIRRLVMKYGYPEDARADLRAAYAAIMRAQR
jgi:hypothetical protein